MNKQLPFAKSVWSSWGVFILFAVDAAHDDLLYRKFIRKSNKILSIKIYIVFPCKNFFFLVSSC